MMGDLIHDERGEAEAAHLFHPNSLQILRMAGNHFE